MATVFRRMDCWYIGHTNANGKFVRRSLGKISEEQAKKVLQGYRRGKPEHSQGVELSSREFMFLHRGSRERARVRCIPFGLTVDDVKAMFERAGGKCEVSGIPFNTFRPANATKRPWYPSIDRIDSKKPYTVDNCRLVCVAVNIAMGEWGLSVLNAIARAMITGNPGDHCQGPEAKRYSFPKIKGEKTVRQIWNARRRGEEVTNESRTDTVSV